MDATIILAVLDEHYRIADADVRAYAADGLTTAVLDAQDRRHAWGLLYDAVNDGLLSKLEAERARLVAAAAAVTR